MHRIFPGKTDLMTHGRTRQGESSDVDNRQVENEGGNGELFDEQSVLIRQVRTHIFKSEMELLEEKS